jgi:hypothetical protein
MSLLKALGLYNYHNIMNQLKDLIHGSAMIQPTNDFFFFSKENLMGFLFFPEISIWVMAQ